MCKLLDVSLMAKPQSQNLTQPAVAVIAWVLVLLVMISIQRSSVRKSDPCGLQMSLLQCTGARKKGHTTSRNWGSVVS